MSTRDDAPTSLASARATAARCAGVEPQQPPTTFAPWTAKRATWAEKELGSSGYTTLPSSTCGTPAFGLTHNGAVRSASKNSETSCAVSASERPQLAPTAA